MDEKWDKKGRIMAAAEEIMSLKGLTESTISEISRTAGVADSIIYQHFRGKEDLLFSIPAERMKEVLTCGSIFNTMTTIQDIPEYYSSNVAHPKISIRHLLIKWSENMRESSLVLWSKVFKIECSALILILDLSEI